MTLAAARKLAAIERRLRRARSPKALARVLCEAVELVTDVLLRGSRLARNADARGAVAAVVCRWCMDRVREGVQE